MVLKGKQIDVQITTVSIIPFSALEYLYTISKYITGINSVTGLNPATAILQVSLELLPLYHK